MLKRFMQGDDREQIAMFSVSDEEDNLHEEDYPQSLPLLVLKNTVLFPGLIIPITVGRDKSLKALRQAEKEGKVLAVISQKDKMVEDPSFDDLYAIGTVAKIMKILTMPDGSVTAILQGRRKYELKGLAQDEPFLIANISLLEPSPIENTMEYNATISSITDHARQIIELSPQIPSEAVIMLQNIKSNKFLLSFISSNLNLNLGKKQQLLESVSLEKMAEDVLRSMDAELQLLKVKSEIESKVRGDINQQQKEYFLNQQLKTIQEELGQNPQSEQILKLEEKGKKKDWPEHVAKAFDKEIQKAKRINPQIAEYSVTLNYLEMLLDLPWNEVSKDNFDLKKVKKVLDADHFGMEKVKDRILEHLAVLKLKGDMKAPILCLVGPPGVGKTSLGKSIANALDRNFIRMSLGGLHDESEIRGHRKTYIGAMPGRIVQSLKKAKTSNPVFILDEIDKLGKTFRGDPSSALLEVLDPEQNETFYDNYLELEYNLSKVLFIATANSLSSIQPALLDRMEIIQLSGYSVEEKIEIAKKHLIPKQITNHGLKPAQISLSKAVVKKIIQEYTREAGVRSLDRTIGSVLRNIAKKVALEEKYNVKLTEDEVTEILGPKRVSPDSYTKVDVPGVVVGLAWTSVGGDILFVEASKSRGKGKFNLTGNLGDVMKESATTAYSFIKAHADQLDIDDSIFAESELHIHVPQGAVPKDGPSAGVTMLTAITSALTGRKAKPYLAMTGEITLRGKVLPVGGIKEKILAAKRAGIKDIVLCPENEKDVAEIGEQYIKGINFHYFEKMLDVLNFALV